MFVLLCGDREWSNRLIIEHALSKLHLSVGIDLLLHGAYRGADQMGDAVARELDIQVEPHPADWRRYGRLAGPRRNHEMLVRLLDLAPKPGPITNRLVLAFHDHILSSKGTRDMVEQAHQVGVECWVLDSRGDRWVWGRGAG